MTEIGYKLSSEEHGPRALVDNARRSEEAGFSFAVVSDHYHPWIDRQGNSPFVWAVLGGIAQVTERLRVGTGVTCPTIRTHPGIIAHAAATCAVMLPGRFFLGVGSGEYLNEHIMGDAWPPAGTRLEMLEEAVDIMRLLWEGRLTSHEGDYYTLDNARIYSVPDEPPPVYIAAAGSQSIELAGRVGDGLIAVAPEEGIVEGFENAGGRGKPRLAEVHVCWAEDEASAARTAHEWWPNIAMGGQLGQDLALPSHYEAVAELVEEDDVTEVVACGPDPEVHLATFEKFLDAGYDHLFVHQIGPDQKGFLDFYSERVLPKLG